MSSGSSISSSWSLGSPAPSEGSSTDSEEDDHGLDAFFGGTRPSQRDYESYTTLVRHIDQGDTLVAKRILAVRPSERQPSPSLAHLNGEVLEEDQPAAIKIRHGKGGRSKGLSSAWPLHPPDLDQQPGDEANSITDAIMAFASAYIRQNQLVHPHQRSGPESTELVELDEVLPSFLPSMMDKVDSLLSSLSMMRPADSAKGRERMKPMGWESIVSAGMLSSLDPSVLSIVNEKMRSLLNVEGDDILRHRLDTLVELKSRGPEFQPLSEMLSQARTKQSKESHRPHLSQTEREVRGRKRAAKAAKRLEKAKARDALASSAGPKGQIRNAKRKKSKATPNT